MHDIIVVGGGPAGLTAALYGLRNGKSVLLIEKSVFGGQIVNSPKVENIPGFLSISGDEFADQYLDQVMAQGADVMMEEVLTVSKEDEIMKVSLADGSTEEGKTVILATGTTHRTLGLPEEEELIGNGISFCAVCDGDFYRDKEVVMIGGGNSAFVEGILLADIVKKLTVLQDLPYFTADYKLQEQLLTRTNVETHVQTTVQKYCVENGLLNGVEYVDASGKVQSVSCDGVFLAIGLVPENSAYENLAALDSYGYFASDENCHTGTPGVFVAGDCRTKSLRQVTTACADGARAAIAACEYINAQNK